MAVLAVVLGSTAYWALCTSGAEGYQDSWWGAVLALVSALGFSVVRLVVWMFLSYIHLATDTAGQVNRPVICRQFAASA